MAGPTVIPDDLSDLDAEQIQSLRDELRLSRLLSDRLTIPSRPPHLPQFSGDSKGVRFSNFISAINSISRNNDESTIVHSIRKALTGSAADVISILSYEASKDEIISALETNFGDVSDVGSYWQEFYNATQHPKESLIEWRTRLHKIYLKTGNTTDSDVHLKTRLYHGLRDQKLRDQSRHVFDNSNIKEPDLMQYLRKLDTEKVKATSSLQNSASLQYSDELKELKKQVADLKKLLEESKKEKKPKSGERSDNKQSQRRQRFDQQDQHPNERENNHRRYSGNSYQYQQPQPTERHFQQNYGRSDNQTYYQRPPYRPSYYNQEHTNRSDDRNDNRQPRGRDDFPQPSSGQDSSNLN